MSSKPDAAIGVAGYMGSGKSTVAGLLAERGWSVIDADSVAKDLMSSSATIRRRLADTFGEEVLDGDQLSFKKLGERAYESDRSLQQLNGIVHPPLVQELARGLRACDDGRSVLDAALITLWGIEDWFRSLCWVEAPRDVRLARLAAKLPLTREEILRRMALQESSVAEPGDTRWVRVPNGGSVEELAQYLASEAFEPVLLTAEQN